MNTKILPRARAVGDVDPAIVLAAIEHLKRQIARGCAPCREALRQIRERYAVLLGDQA